MSGCGPVHVCGLRDAEDRDEAVWPGDDHSVDERSDECLALVGRAGANDLREVVGDLVEQCRVGRGGHVVEGGGEFVAAGGELLAGGLEGREAFGKVFIEGAAFEGEQVVVGGLLGAGEFGGDGVQFGAAVTVCGPVLASGLVDGGGDEVAVVRATRKWSLSTSPMTMRAASVQNQPSRILVWV